MKKDIFNKLLIIIFLFVTACQPDQKKGEHDGHKHEQNEGEEHDHEHSENEEGHEHAEGEEHKDEIAFRKEQAKATGLQLETVTAGTFSQVIKTSGQIQAAQGDEVVIAATANGIVTFAGKSFSEGSAVKAGQTIVDISAKKLLDGDPAAKVRIEYEAAAKDYKRASELVKENIISARDYEQKRSRYELARSAYEALGSSQGGVKLLSPISGFIKQLKVKQGDYVSVGQPVAVVSQNRRLQLKAEVSEKYFKYLSSMSTANFKTAYDNTVYKLSELNGRLLSYGKAADSESFYIPVTFEFDNKGEVIPGSYVEVYLLAAPQNGIISVPLSAITEEQGVYYTYIQLDEEGYKKQEITPGQNNGERVQVISGLKAGDKVVTRGVYEVKLASMSSVIPEGHSHSH
jgi:RND family efflux transporter MFP subunit